MKKAGMAMSATIGLNGQVDLEHSGKGQVSRASFQGRREEGEAEAEADLSFLPLLRFVFS